MDNIKLILKNIEEESSCKTPGEKIRSKGKGRGMAKGKGKGPIGTPISTKEQEYLNVSKKYVEEFENLIRLLEGKGGKSQKMKRRQRSNRRKAKQAFGSPLPLQQPQAQSQPRPQAQPSVQKAKSKSEKIKDYLKRKKELAVKGIKKTYKAHPKKAIGAAIAIPAGLYAGSKGYVAYKEKKNRDEVGGYAAPPAKLKK